MKKRWVAAGMLEAERNFRRVRGYKEMAELVAALGRQAHPALSHPKTTIRLLPDQQWPPPNFNKVLLNSPTFALVMLISPPTAPLWLVTQV